jgi:hypothetical protein
MEATHRGDISGCQRWAFPPQGSAMAAKSSTAIEGLVKGRNPLDRRTRLQRVGCGRDRITDDLSRGHSAIVA